jgi:transposase
MDDVSRGKPSMTVGIDLGDKHSYLCLLDTESGEVIEEGRLRTTPEALRRRFSLRSSSRCESPSRRALTPPG